MDTHDELVVEETLEVERATKSFDPETVLPLQFFPSAASASMPGEKRLMVAVLGDAIDTYLKHGRSQSFRARGLFAEAAEWIESRDTTWPFSFERICEALDLDPTQVRRLIRARAADATPRKAWHRAPVVTRCRMRTRRGTGTRPSVAASLAATGS